MESRRRAKYEVLKRSLEMGGKRSAFSTCVWALTLSVCLEHGQASKCQKLAALAALEDHNTVVETNLKLLSGTWLSEGCETRPGPEYLLRFYTFGDDGNYELIQHRYWDDSCSSPKLTIISHGKLVLRNNLLQPGASSGIARVANISVTPQDNDAAKELDEVTADECEGQYWKSWRRYEEQVVYDERYDDKRKTHNLWVPRFSSGNDYRSVNNRGNNVHFSDISCLGSLKWAFNELKLLKIQLRPIVEKLKKRIKEMKMELLLGDTHTNPRFREFHTPNSFQVPLIKQANNQTVVVQRRTYLIKNPNTIPSKIFTNGKTPPHLNEKPHLPPYIWGEWTSIRCEIRPMGLYLTRRFSIYSEDHTWIGEHKFYSDPFCVTLKFIITAAGHFNLAGPSREVKGSNNIDFQIEKASLEVSDQRMIYEKRLSGFCGEGEWEVNVPKELSSTNGCAQFGILLPSVLFDIVKVEMDYQGACLLYFGQVDTDSMHAGSISSERPTAFKLPLVKCGDVGSYSQSLRDLLGDMYYNSSQRISDFSSLLIILSVLIVR